LLPLPSFPTRRSSDLVLARSSSIAVSIATVVLPAQAASPADCLKMHNTHDPKIDEYLDKGKQGKLSCDEIPDAMARSRRADAKGDRKSTRLNSSHVAI